MANRLRFTRIVKREDLEVEMHPKYKNSARMNRDVFLNIADTYDINCADECKWILMNGEEFENSGDARQRLRIYADKPQPVFGEVLVKIESEASYQVRVYQEQLDIENSRSIKKEYLANQSYGEF